MDKILEQIERITLYAIVFLVPIAVAPISPNIFTPIKLTVLAFGVGIVLLVKALRIITTGKFEFSLGSFDFPVLLLALAYLGAAVARTPNKMEAILLPGTATLMICSAILYFLVNQLGKKEKTLTVEVLTASGAAFSVIILTSYSQLLSNISFLPAYLRSNIFTPGESYLPSAVFLAVLVPLVVGRLIKEKKLVKRIFLATSLTLIAVSLILSVYNLLPGRPGAPKLLGLNTSWSIAIDTLKASPVFGVGPGNYLTAFSQFQPVDFNSSDLWPFKFSAANNFYLTVLTETGLIGALAVILLFLVVYRFIGKSVREKGLAGKGLIAGFNLMALVLALVLLALFPGTIISIFLLFVILSLNAVVEKSSSSLVGQLTSKGDLGHSTKPGLKKSKDGLRGRFGTRFPAILVTLPVFLIVIFSGLKAVRILRAEYQYRLALTALASNDAANAYDMLQEAIQINPAIDRYRASYSQINLGLANAIIQQASASEGEVITDADRSNIAQLIQQSIREAKAVVALNPQRSANWEILAKTYQAIMPLAKGSDVFAAQTYNQAIALDPMNPNLRISLGGILYSMGDFENAIRMYLVAARVKPDLANAHYNLSFALTETGNFEEAIREMTIVLSLVEADSSDYQTAVNVLKGLEEQKQLLDQEATQNLTPPLEETEPVLEPPIELSVEEEPPEPSDLEDSTEETNSTSPTPASDEDSGNGETVPSPTFIP